MTLDQFSDHDLLRELERRLKSLKRSAHPVVERIARDTGIDPDRILSVSRVQSVCRARDLCAHTLHHEHPDLSWQDIGMILGGRDHSTVSLAANRHRSRCNGHSSPRHDSSPPPPPQTP